MRGIQRIHEIARINGQVNILLKFHQMIIYDTIR